MNSQSHKFSQKTFSAVSRQDGLVLDVLALVPESPKAIVQLAHGMCEHKERYLPFMEYLAGLGFLCVINDHRGHGKSVRGMEDLGYFYANGGPSLVKDLHQITSMIRKQYPDLPFFFFGHSMGSLAARVYLKYYEKELDGLVVCGSPSNQPMAGFGLFLVRLLSRIKGSHARSPLVNQLFSASFEKPFQSEGMVHAWISKDRSVVEAYNASPYCNFTFTLNGYESLLWLVQQTYSRKGWNVRNPDLPILFVSGSDDPCMVSKKKFQKSAETLRKAGYKHVSAKLYSGLRHEILNEKERCLVYKDISAFFTHILS